MINFSIWININNMNQSATNIYLIVQYCFLYRDNLFMMLLQARFKLSCPITSCHISVSPWVVHLTLHIEPCGSCPTQQTYYAASWCKFWFSNCIRSPKILILSTNFYAIIVYLLHISPLYLYLLFQFQKMCDALDHLGWQQVIIDGM